MTVFRKCLYYCTSLLFPKQLLLSQARGGVVGGNGEEVGGGDDSMPSMSNRSVSVCGSHSVTEKRQKAIHPIGVTACDLRNSMCADNDDLVVSASLWQWPMSPVNHPIPSMIISWPVSNHPFSHHPSQSVVFQQQKLQSLVYLTFSLSHPQAAWHGIGHSVVEETMINDVSEEW